jgi:hypothetical protein
MNKKSTLKQPQQSVHTPTTDLAKTAKAQLEELLPQIQGKHEMVEHRLADTLEYAQQAGELLLEAKKLAGHGGWLPYLKECGIPDRTASGYMRIAKQWGKVKSATLPDLSYRGAIAYLAAEEKEEKERIKRLRAQEKADAVEDAEDDPFDGNLAAERDARIRARDAEWEAGEPERAARRKAEEAAVEKKLTLAQDLIMAGYKVLAAKAHPDKGGSNTAMQELNELRDDLIKVVESTYYVAVQS